PTWSGTVHEPPYPIEEPLRAASQRQAYLKWTPAGAHRTPVLCSRSGLDPSAARRPRFRWTKRATRSAPEPESPWSKFVLSRPANPMEQRHRHVFVQPHGKRERSLLEKRAEPVRGAMAVAARSGALVGAPLPVVHVEQDGIPVDRVPEGLWGRHSGREHGDPGANGAW